MWKRIFYLLLENIRGIRISRMSYAHFSAGISAFQHTFPKLTDCPFLSAAFVQGFKFPFVACLPDNTYPEKTCRHGKRGAHTAVFCEV